MDSRFWNGLSAGFRRFWKQRLPIEIFRIEAYMTVVGLPSALNIYILKLCTSLSRNDGSSHSAACIAVASSRRICRTLWVSFLTTAFTEPFQRGSPSPGSGLVRLTAQLSHLIVALAQHLLLFLHDVPPALYVLQRLRDPQWGACCLAFPAPCSLKALLGERSGHPRPW